MSCCTNKGFWSNVTDYVTATVKWIQAGRPKRSKKEILERWNICQHCEHFQHIEGKPWRGRCNSCGCYLGRHAHKLLQGNKIAMRTEKCPDGKWE